ncbi:intermembrane transport protein PqiB [Marinobacter changyiensis]|uniref:PqiB family protein n=1 Tax=Marinobacter changyiensis TaxID=2604091 RepID=UPI0012641298|nr:MlaD family protein [Marinobacter changyiensis]
MSNNPATNEPGEADIRSRRVGLSLAWLVPIVAALVGLSMLVGSWRDAGPTIEITFDTAGSLTPEKSPVKYRNVAIGEVRTITLSKDQQNVVVAVDLNKDAEAFAREDARFWVVKPRIGAGGVSGLDTLLSGDFIAAIPGTSETSANNFRGLETPPPITYDEPGKRFRLRAPDLGSLDIGSAVYYRKVRVGEVVSYQLDPSGEWVNLGVFITAPHDQYVTSNSRFWNASGIDLGITTDGIQLDLQSLTSVLAGGIAFETPARAPAAKAASTDRKFTLYNDRTSAMAPDKGPAHSIHMRFGQSLLGLKQEAPVYFMGNEIGEVTSVTLDYDAKQQTFPVVVDARIYPRLMGQAYDQLLETVGDEADVDTSKSPMATRLFRQLVDHGLRAEARTSNILTGQLHIALEFYSGAQNAQGSITPDNPDQILIPTQATNLDKMQDQLTSLLETLNSLPLATISSNLEGSLAELQQTLGAINDEALPATVNILQGMEELMNSMSSTLTSAEAALSPNSPERQRLGLALDEVERMSRSVRELSDYLRRHPESLVRGRDEQGRGEFSQ